MSEHRTREADGCIVVDVAPSYSRQSFLELASLVKSKMTAEKPRVILNLSELPHINSECIGLLVLVHDECRKHGGRMALASLPQRVERVLKLAGVLTFFEKYPDERAAASALVAEVPIEGAGDSGAEAPAPEAAPAEPAKPEDLESEVRDIVRTMIRSRRHQEVIEFYGKRTTKVASLDEIAGQVGIPRLTAEYVVADFVGAEVLVREGEVYAWAPSEEARRRLENFRRAISSPRLRTRVMAWLYAEEKR
jgi:anti-anti-sigma factor